MSYSDIRERMAVPLSTLSKWFHDQKWSNDIAMESAKRARSSAAIRLTVLNTVRGSRLRKIYDDASQDALIDYSELKFHPLFMAGVMMYWSHGDKTSKQRISLSSTDPKVISIFKLFLEKVCSVTNMRVQVLISREYNREVEIRGYWQENCRLQPQNFIKTIQSKQIKPKKQSNKPYFGVCNLIVNSAYLKNKILKWVELMSEEIVQEKYLSTV